MHGGPALPPPPPAITEPPDPHPTLHIPRSGRFTGCGEHGNIVSARSVVTASPCCTPPPGPGPEPPLRPPMPAGRNAPCPCGSGRKYKNCCLHTDLEREAERMLAEQGDWAPSSESLHADPEMRELLRAAARKDATWEAGAIPLPAGIREDPECRMVVLLVATRDAVLAMDSLRNLPGETEDVASALHGIVQEAMRRTGARPRLLHVAHPEVAGALAPLLRGSGIRVEALGGFDRLHDPARSLVENLSGVDLWPPMSKPETWAAWQLPEAEVAALFRAAAEFFRAAPWCVLADGEPLGFEPEGGAPWAGAIMGQGGEVFGLALYAEPGDLMSLYEGPGIEDDDDATGVRAMPGAQAVLGAMEGRVITLLFEEANDLPRPMRREVARKGWEVASPSAYPTLVVMNTPGGGVSRADLRVLTEALTLVPRFLAAGERADGPATLLPEWTSPETGTVVFPLFAAGSGGPFGPPLVLEPGYARGKAARPGAFLVTEDGAEDPGPAVEEAYRAAIGAVNGFGSALDRTGMGEATIMTHVRNAAEFVRFLVSMEGVPLGGLHERDLRSFLLDWHPRTFGGGVTQARRMPVSLDRFFEFLERHMGLRCPWAADILADRELIELRLETAPGGSLLDPEVLAWRAPFLADMEQRLLRPHLDEVHASWIREEPTRAMNLVRELTRSWLLWRDELIESGIREAGGELRGLLLERQREWMEALATP
ncbi:MAG: hypothetical protein EA350_02405 [Gemmatimonadales bacterium]|nr:MAG: hypothetical protein EA350_02405 [Gemmatimonadales bacterium]